MTEPKPSQVRVLFVFAWLVVGGEETEVRLLAANLDPERYRIDVVACFRKAGMPDQTHQQLSELGVDVDIAPYEMSFEDTVVYLADKVAGYDIVVSCQNVADIYPALERLHLRPPLIEHGGLVSEAQAGPKHFTTRYVGVCRSIRDAAAARMPEREHDAVEIPSMVDLGEFDRARRDTIRRGLGVGPGDILIGWVGRLDPKKNVQDFIRAAAITRMEAKSLKFVLVGGPDAFHPEYAVELARVASTLGLDTHMQFLGDRKDVPDLMVAMDIFVWLSKGEGMPHVVSEAGAAGLPVIVTPDGGVLQQVQHTVSGLVVPYCNAAAVAAAIMHLLDPDERLRLGEALRNRVVAQYSVEAVLPQWERLFREVLEERKPGQKSKVFNSFLQGGFECSTHRLRPRQEHLEGKRLDVIRATRHDDYAYNDYIRLQEFGIRTVRDGFRWHLIDRNGRFDWSSVRSMLRAASTSGTQVIWDLLHYGWPDDIDIWSPHFVDRFAAFARACAQVVGDETDMVPFFCPVNEISFLAWGGGDASYLNPFAHSRGFELKVQLVRAAIAAMDAILDVDPRARFVHCEPRINVVRDRQRPWDAAAAEGHRLAQFQAWDMIEGRMWPQLGGKRQYLDVIGVNYYFNNQWIHGGPPIDIEHRDYKPLRNILAETYARYGRPLMIAETGIEGDRRAAWITYVANETRAAVRMGVPMEGVCLYPVVNHPGWDDDRACENGLLSAAVTGDARTIADADFAEALGKLFPARRGARWGVEQWGS